LECAGSTELSFQKTASIILTTQRIQNRRSFAQKLLSQSAIADCGTSLFMQNHPACYFADLDRSQAAAQSGVEPPHSKGCTNSYTVFGLLNLGVMVCLACATSTLHDRYTSATPVNNAVHKFYTTPDFLFPAKDFFRTCWTKPICF
jgi:hypothetical protein